MLRVLLWISLFANSLTESGKRLSYARICVEVTSDSPFLNSTDIEYADGRTAVVTFKYPWRPSLCFFWSCFWSYG